MIAERFRNIDAIANVSCPTFILHGMKDTMVKFAHSQLLCDACGGPTFLLLPENMDHNSLDVIGDFVAPLSEFLENFGVKTMNFPNDYVSQDTGASILQQPTERAPTNGIEIRTILHSPSTRRSHNHSQHPQSLARLLNKGESIKAQGVVVPAIPEVRNWQKPT